MENERLVTSCVSEVLPIEAIRDKVEQETFADKEETQAESCCEVQVKSEGLTNQSDERRDENTLSRMDTGPSQSPGSTDDSQVVKMAQGEADLMMVSNDKALDLSDCADKNRVDESISMSFSSVHVSQDVDDGSTNTSNIYVDIVQHSDSPLKHIYYNFEKTPKDAEKETEQYLNPVERVSSPSDFHASPPGSPAESVKSSTGDFCPGLAVSLGSSPLYSAMCNNKSDDSTQVINVTLPIHSRESGYLIDPALGTIQAETPSKRLRLSETAESPSPDYHPQLSGLQLPLYDTLPVLHLKDEEGLLHASPRLSQHMLPQHTSPTKVLPSLAAFSKAHIKSVVDPHMGTVLQIPEHKDDGSKVQVMYSAQRDVYSPAFGDALSYDTDDSTTTLSSCDLPAIDPHMFLEESPPGKPGMHIIPDLRGKPYLVTINDEALPKVETKLLKPSRRQYRRHREMYHGGDVMTAHEMASGDQHRAGLVFGEAGKKHPTYTHANKLALSGGSLCREGDKENQGESSSCGGKVLSTWKVHAPSTKQPYKPAYGGPPQVLGQVTSVKRTHPGYDRPPEGYDRIGTSQAKYPQPGASLPVPHDATPLKYPPQGRTMTADNYTQQIPLANLSNKQPYHVPPSTTTTSTPLSLNSSGSEDGPSPPAYLYPLPPGGGPALYPHYPIPPGPAGDAVRLDSPTPMMPTAGQLNAALYRAKESLSDTEMDIGRQAHNAKERARRARIKIACEHLRDLVPGMTNKTDKATVFEFAVSYIDFIKRFVGIQYDKEFLRQCNPY